MFHVFFGIFSPVFNLICNNVFSVICRAQWPQAPAHAQQLASNAERGDISDNRFGDIIGTNAIHSPRAGRTGPEEQCLWVTLRICRALQHKSTRV